MQRTPTLLLMKAYFYFFFLLFIPFTSFCQVNTVTIKVKDTRNLPMSNVKVTAAHADGSVNLTGTTNAVGEVDFKLEKPGFYNFSYLDVKNAVSVEIKEGFSGNFKRSVTYDPKGVFAEKPKIDRTGIVFTELTARQLRGQPNVAEVTILVKDMQRTLVPNVPMKVVCLADKAKYTGSANASGQAVFYVPIGKDYEVDVENSESYHTFSVPNQAGLMMTEVVFYEKTKIQEIKKGDTIIQSNIAQTSGTSMHVLFTLTVVNHEGKVLPNESVFMADRNGKRVYQATTNDKGMCKFLLEKGTDYILNFKYEQNVFLVEATKIQGFQTASATRRYRGSLEIEAMIAAQKEEMRRIEEQRKFQEEALKRKLEEDKKLAAEYKRTALIPREPITTAPVYRTTPVKSIAAPVNYIKKTPEGYEIDFPSNAGMAGTPTILDNKLFVQEGEYSSNFYCLNPADGAFKWGIEMGESGPSPAVYHQGVILINTESCTLYALDANSGKFLWSKWLSGYVFSTPTASGDQVYVTYRHGSQPVLVSFDLRSGNFKWMQELDEEAYACPVVFEDEVHVTTQAGTYYKFNKISGIRTATSRDIKAISTPTVTQDFVFLTAKIDDAEKLVSLNRSDLTIKKVYDTPYDALENIHGPVQQMSFNGSHPVVYQNKYILLADKGNLYAFSTATEKLLWQKPLKATYDQVPIVVNGKVYIAAEAGKILTFDLETGSQQLLSKGNTGTQTEGQAVYGNGYVFVSSSGVVRATKTSLQSDWHQWNKDAGHNLVW